MEFYYKTNDWDTLTSKDPNYIDIKGFKVPYGVFENMPEKTDNSAKLGTELERVTSKLWNVSGKS